jgi:hypothetical protein
VRHLARSEIDKLFKIKDWKYRLASVFPGIDKIQCVVFSYFLYILIRDITEDLAFSDATEKPLDEASTSQSVLISSSEKHHSEIWRYR